jgi:Secretion system C-terminal sorting domain
MRPFITFILVFFILPLAEAQINLVPNPSFEDTISCPTVLDNLQDVQDWSSYGNSADYFNGCSTTGMNVPNTAFGFQYANTGNSFCGVVTYLKGSSSLGSNYREFIGVELNSQLQIGTKYFFSFYAVSAQNNGSIGFFSNNIGLRFFTTSYTQLSPAPLDNFSHLKFDSLLSDTIFWKKISGSFVADSNYNFIGIGNFYDFMNTDTLIYSPFPFCAYSYIDDVCVSSDSLFNETWTGLSPVNANEIYIWPNPVTTYFQFKSNNRIDEIKIYDCRGRFIKSERVNSMNGRIDLDLFSEGLYFATFVNKKTISVHKFFKF